MSKARFINIFGKNVTPKVEPANTAWPDTVQVGHGCAVLGFPKRETPRIAARRFRCITASVLTGLGLRRF